MHIASKKEGGMNLLLKLFYVVLLLAYLVEAYSHNNIPGEGPDDDWFIRCHHSGIDCGFPPTMSPSKQPTPDRQSRITSKTLSPSAVPSPSPCQASNSGFYGDESISNLQSEYIKFDYQMEYGPQGNIDKILKDLESSMLDMILSATPLFPECSSPIRKRALLRGHSVFKRGQEEQGKVVGMSSGPVDMITSNNCPFDTVFSDSRCVVVGGILTLFYENSNLQQLENHSSDIKAVIETGMNDGSLSLSNREIIHLEYIHSYRDTDIPSVDSSHGNTFTLSFLMVSFIMMIAAVAIVILGLCVIMMRRLSRWRKSIATRNLDLDNSSHLVAEAASTSITDDDSTNFISSLGNSEKTLFRIWRQS